MSNAVPEHLQKQTLRRALNKWMQSSKMHATMGPTTDDLIVNFNLSQYATLFEDFQEKTGDWWELEVRIFNRVLLESFCYYIYSCFTSWDCC